MERMRREASTKATDPWAGVKRTMPTSKGFQEIDQIIKVKAHVEESARTWKETANEWADHFAKAGAKQHMEGSAQEKADLAEAEAKIKSICALVVALWPLWPAMGTNRRAARQRKEEIEIIYDTYEPQRHEWQEAGPGAWQCKLCLAVAADKEAHGRREGQACRFEGSAAEAYQEAGHQVVLAIGAGLPSFLVCTRCGAYGSWQARNLKQQCPKKLEKGGLNSLRCVARGRHPRWDRVEDTLLEIWDPVGARPVSREALQRCCRAAGRGRGLS
jgi:hypothetical protein